MTITAPIQKPPAGRVLRWGRENVAVGTPPVGNSGAPIIIEPVTDVDTTAFQRDIYTAAEQTGAMTDAIGMDELTHYEQLTINTPFRMNGISAQALIGMLGSQSYSPSGPTGGKYTHTAIQQPYTNRCNTYTVWWQDTVDQINMANYLSQYTRVTPTGISLTFGGGTILEASISAYASWPTSTLPPASFSPSSTVAYLNAPVATFTDATHFTVAAGYGALFTAGAAFFNGVACTISTVTGDAIVLSLGTASAGGTLTQAPAATKIGVQAGAGSQFTVGGSLTITGVTGTPTVTAVIGDNVVYSGGTGTAALGASVVQAQVAGASTIYIGSDANRTITRTAGWQGFFQFYGSSGSIYNARILSGTLNLSRPVEPVYAADSQTIIDIALGTLSVSGSAVFQFDGYGAGTVGYDFRNYKPTGTLANPNLIKFTDADGNYFQITSYPWKWHPFTPDYSGQFVKGSGTFTAYNDPAQVMQQNQVLTAVKGFSLVNNISTAMLDAST